VAQTSVCDFARLELPQTEVCATKFDYGGRRES
jgi:hypothetical protein